MYFTGKNEYVTIKSLDGDRVIDKLVYTNSLADPNVGFDSIRLQIDGVVYEKTVVCTVAIGKITQTCTAVDLCILLVYHAALGKTLKSVTFLGINYKTLDKLPALLIVVQWSNQYLKKSTTYLNYIFTIYCAVQVSIDIMRSIVCYDDCYVGGKEKRMNYIRLLKYNGIDTEIPEFLPKLKSISDGEYKIVSKYIYTMLVKVITYENPTYGKIQYFGDECDKILNTIIDFDILNLYVTKGLTFSICGVYKKGIQYVLL
jgi:hypothetical protein